MRVSILTREYPPYIYGGAGVHVGQLVPQLRKFCDSVDVQCMGEPREGATAHAEDYPAGANGAIRTLGADVAMAAAVPPVDVIHSHTWYAQFAGIIAGGKATMAVGGFASVAKGRAFFRNVRVREVGYPAPAGR